MSNFEKVPIQNLSHISPDTNQKNKMYEYFDINLFKGIIETNYMKTRNMINLDSETPPTKKSRNDFTVDDIFQGDF